MSNKMPPGLEIMGYGTLEPNQYMKPVCDNERKSICPLKELAGKEPYCTKGLCAWWNSAKGCCGIVR